MKRKILISCFLMMLSSVISLLISYNVHCLLSGNRELFSADPAVLISGLLNEPKIGTLFIVLVSAAALGITYMLVMQNYIKYKSDMQTVTPDILTPKPAGQGQYGTARWLDRRKFSSTFSSVKVDSSELIKQLVLYGDDDFY